MIHIFVEGKEDEEFLNAYLKYLKLDANLEYGFTVCYGCNQKKNIQNEVKVKEINGKIIFIFDADEDYQQKLKDLLRYSEKLEENDIFLFPNKKDNGNLEDLLFKIPKFPEIVDCFNCYKKCIEKIDAKNKTKYVKNIGKKSIRFAYFEALGYSSTQKAEERQENYEKFFNFDSLELEPLKEFLKKHLTPSDLAE